ncbi:MAG TPA: TetR/AcrR family transcriptional regulator [Solirubrobacteraceae bacterium]|jgi:AcrR family transcriptional regulator|nr:TetR/AcrR family transcriptional regulator [Solirubrobacteraceae bacterium]
MARRLSRDERREQLVAAAMPVLARRGLRDYSLEEIAERAGVTRNLLYHYFPRGRPDVTLAVAERAAEQLTADWAVDETVPLAQRLADNFNRIAEHAMRPTHAWQIHRLARAASEPELREMVARFVRVVIANVAQNHLGTADPPALVRLALKAYVAFAETALDEARVTGADRHQVTSVLANTLLATIDAATVAAGNASYRAFATLSET